MIATPVRSARSPLQLVAFVLSLPAAVVPFVPFCWGVSPLKAVQEIDSMHWNDLGIPLLGITFFLGLPIVAAQAFRLLEVPFHRGLRCATWLGFSVAGAATATVSVQIINHALRERADGSVVGASVGLAALFLIATALVLARRWFRDPAAPTVLPASLVLAFPYAGNALICLIAFVDDRQIGWWLTVAALLGLALDLFATAHARAVHTPAPSAAAG